jgi:uncharacterized membrane protein YphA (DoxX/SURF4 family)
VQTTPNTVESSFHPANTSALPSQNAGRYLLGWGTVAAGILDLAWRDFDPGHQPIDALGVTIPARAVFACIAGIWMIVSGAALVRERSAHWGALAAAILYSIVGLFSVPHFYSMPHKYGFHWTLIFGVIGEMLQQFIVVAACLLLLTNGKGAGQWQSRSKLIARVVFGLSGVLFGLAHLDNTRGIAPMIPHWLPLDPSFCVQFTGVAFILAGIAILAGVQDVLAARLLALMLLLFEIILVPLPFQFPNVHQAWGATAYNLTVAGAVWIYATTIAPGRTQRTATAE